MLCVMWYALCGLSMYVVDVYFVIDRAGMQAKVWVARGERSLKHFLGDNDVVSFCVKP